MEKDQKHPDPAPAITCGPENVAAFNARLRAALPEFHAFAAACHKLGLIDGLRGARIGPAGGFERGVQPTPSLAAEKRQLDRKWEQGRAQR